MYLAPVPISSLQQDDSRRDIIAASTPDVLNQRVDEQGENIHLIGTLRAQNSGIGSELTSSTRGNAYTQFFVLSEAVTSEGNRPHPAMGASVHPADGDPYTPFFCPS
jgi:hypothetical protein